MSNKITGRPSLIWKFLIVFFILFFLFGLIYFTINLNIYDVGLLIISMCLTIFMLYTATIFFVSYSIGNGRLIISSLVGRDKVIDLSDIIGYSVLGYSVKFYTIDSNFEILKTGKNCDKIIDILIRRYLYELNLSSDKIFEKCKSFRTGILKKIKISPLGIYYGACFYDWEHISIVKKIYRGDVILFYLSLANELKNEKISINSFRFKGNKLLFKYIEDKAQDCSFV